MLTDTRYCHEGDPLTRLDELSDDESWQGVGGIGWDGTSKISSAHGSRNERLSMPYLARIHELRALHDLEDRSMRA